MTERYTGAQLNSDVAEVKELISTFIELLQTPEGFLALLIVFLTYIANKGLLASMFKALFDKTNEQFKFIEKLVEIKNIDEQVVKLGIDSIAEKAFKRFTRISTSKPKIDALIHLEKNTTAEINWTIIKRAFSNISIKSPTNYTINKPRLNDTLSYYYNELVIKLLFILLMGTVPYLLFIAPKTIDTFILFIAVVVFLLFLIILIASTNFNFNATVKLYNELKPDEDDEISAESLFQHYTSKFLPKILNERPTTTIFIVLLLVILVVYLWRLSI